jgi:hypothetical protein
MNEIIKKMDHELKAVKKKALDIKNSTNIDYGSDAIKRYKKVLENFDRSKAISEQLNFTEKSNNKGYSYTTHQYLEEEHTNSKNSYKGKDLVSKTEENFPNTNPNANANTENLQIKSDGFRNHHTSNLKTLRQTDHTSGSANQKQPSNNLPWTIPKKFQTPSNVLLNLQNNHKPQTNYGLNGYNTTNKYIIDFRGLKNQKKSEEAKKNRVSQVKLKKVMVAGNPKSGMRKINDYEMKIPHRSTDTVLRRDSVFLTKGLGAGGSGQGMGFSETPENYQKNANLSYGNNPSVGGNSTDVIFDDGVDLLKQPLPGKLIENFEYNSYYNADPSAQKDSTKNMNQEVQPQTQYDYETPRPITPDPVGPNPDFLGGQQMEYSAIELERQTQMEEDQILQIQNEHQQLQMEHVEEEEFLIPDEQEVISNIQRLRSEKASLEKEISDIESKKLLNMETANKILKVRRDYEDKFIQRFFSAFKKKQNGFEDFSENDFEIKMRLIESEQRTRADPNIIELMSLDYMSNLKQLAYGGDPVLENILGDEQRPISREERPKSKGITKGLIDKLAEELETIKQYSDDNQIYMRQKILSSLMSHYSPSEHDF